MTVLHATKKLMKPLERPLTPEELADIDSLEDFNKQQRAVVDMFLSTNNAPRTRREMATHKSHIQQINRILKENDIAIGLHYTYTPGRAWRGLADNQTELIRFKTLK